MTGLVNYPQYDSYKDSGIDWLGQIPQRWDISPGFNAFTENKRNNKGMKEDVVLSLSYGKIIIKPKEKLIGLVPESFETYQIVEPGDIIVRCTDLQNDKTSLRTGLAINHGIITSAYLNLKVTNKYLSKYLHYYLHAVDTSKVIYRLGTGLRQNLSYLDFKRFPVLDILKSEQAEIVNFLDQKTTQIDEAIALKQKQIALLKERKQILIQNAVTQGLNPNTPMKDSGIDGIGKIPEYWKVFPLKGLCKAYGRIGFRGYTVSDLVDEGEGAITISPSNIFEDLMTFKKCSYLSWKKYFESPEIQIQNEDILIVKTGSTFGKIGYVNGLNKPATINPQLLVLKEIKTVKKYLYFVLKSSQVQVQINQKVIGSTIPTISETKILNFKVALPSMAEQQEITQFIENSNYEIDQAITLQKQQIDQLKEYKTTLINSAVTGKIKVS